MPDPHTVMQHKWLRVFGPLFNDPNLLHFNRRSIPMGVAAGVFAAFIPLPVQMFLALGLAIWGRGNIAVAAGFTWISNPATYAPLYYACYVLGTFLIGKPVDANGEPLHFELATLAGNILTVGKPLLLGCVIVGFISAVISFFIVRMLWRLHAIRNWETRRLKRKGCQQEP